MQPVSTPPRFFCKTHPRRYSDLASRRSSCWRARQDVREDLRTRGVNSRSPKRSVSKNELARHFAAHRLLSWLLRPRSKDSWLRLSHRGKPGDMKGRLIGVRTASRPRGKREWRVALQRHILPPGLTGRRISVRSRCYLSAPYPRSLESRPKEAPSPRRSSRCHHRIRTGQSSLIRVVLLFLVDYFRGASLSRARKTYVLWSLPRLVVLAWWSVS